VEFTKHSVYCIKQNGSLMITNEQIADLIKPHQTEIRKWYDEALMKLDQVKEIMGVEVYTRSSSCIINNYILEKAKSYFDGIKDSLGIIVDDKYKSLILYFQKEGTTGRFKKLNKLSLLSGNIETLRSVQLVQGTLFPDFPPTVRIEIGHFFNETGTAYDRILVVKRIDKKVAIPIFEIEPIATEQIVTVTAKEIVLDLEQEQQLKIKDNNNKP
jgi:hypothetical protein